MLWWYLLQSSAVMASPVSEDQQIGVWKFTMVSDTTSTSDTVLLATLEERVRQAILPLLQQHTDLHLVTPENLQFTGPLPSSNRILETSRALELNYVVVGTVIKGNKTTCILKLYHVDTGVLLQQQSVDVYDENELVQDVPPYIEELMVPLLRQNNASAPNILATFDSQPQESTLLFIDGKVQAQCQQLPCAVKLKQGNHNIQFHNPYYEMWSKDLYLEGGSDINAKLKPSFGQLTVTSNPEGVQFELDGVSMGATPLEKYKIEKGEHEISILDPCYMGKDQRFTIQNNDNEKIRLMTLPRMSALNVYLENPTQTAKVYIDEEYIGKTPVSTQVPMCSEKIRVENGYGIFEDTLYLRESQVESLTVTLQKRKHNTKKSKPNKSPRTKSPRAKKTKNRSRRFNPNHSLWSTYTLQYGLESEEFRLGLITMQVKNGSNDSFIAPLLPAWRTQILDYSVNGNTHYLLPFGVGYGFDFELGLVQPYYQWHWLSLPPMDTFADINDIIDQTIYTPYIHKVGVDFLLNHNPFNQDRQQYGGTLQLQASQTFCNGGEDLLCREDTFVGVSLYLSSGRWGF